MTGPRATLRVVMLSGLMAMSGIATAQTVTDPVAPAATQEPAPTPTEPPPSDGPAADAAAPEGPAATPEQTSPAAPTSDVVVEEVVPDLIGPPPPDVGKPRPDYDAWRRVAQRAERMAEVNVASGFAFERLRAELVEWRAQFASVQQFNASRIVTLDAQVEAIGPAPEGVEEPLAVAQRRADLTALRDRLAAPGILANEAYARADGLIKEVDAILREQQRARLMARTPSPLSPSAWPEAATKLSDGIYTLYAETSAKVRANLSNGSPVQSTPQVLVLLAVAMVLLLRGRAWMRDSEMAMLGRAVRGREVWGFLVSLMQIALPLVGALAFVIALEMANVLGRRGTLVADTLLSAAVIIILARWLAGQFFPQPPNASPLGYDEDTRNRARRVTVLLAWVLAFVLPLTALMASGDASDTARAVVYLPWQLLLGALIYRLGSLLRRPPATDTTAVMSQGRLRQVIGQLCRLIGVGAPILAVLGYAAAAQAVFFPAVLTLAILGTVILLQRLTFDVYGLWSGGEDRSKEALMPLLVGFTLFIIALPVLALIWGARVDDLAELWTRFSAGFSIGETRISPSNFLTFVLVFSLGYIITRFVQGTLRTTVLPRTRMDPGGQNAVVSGLGYVGVMLSAVLAITTAGINLSSLAIVAGALSVGIGFGLQNIVSNFVSGIILLIERPVSQGDWIEVAGQMGYVRDISVRSTRIETFDRTDVIVPNADLISGTVTNWTRGNLVGRITVPVGVAYGSDPEKVSAILRDIAETHPMVLMTPPPNVMFQAFGADSLNFEIRAFLRDVNFIGHTRSEMNHAIAKRFAEEGIEIPFAQRDIWLRNPEVLMGQMNGPRSDKNNGES